MTETDWAEAYRQLHGLVRLVSAQYHADRVAYLQDLAHGQEILADAVKHAAVAVAEGVVQQGMRVSFEDGKLSPRAAVLLVLDWPAFQALPKPPSAPVFEGTTKAQLASQGSLSFNEIVARYIGARIRSASLRKESDRGADTLRLEFEDGRVLCLWDAEQYCCECRHMSTDDDLGELEGQELRRIEAKDGESEEDLGEVHDIQFLEIGTDQGFVTLVSHNEHNGYYGGIAILAEEGDKLWA